MKTKKIKYLILLQIGFSLTMFSMEVFAAINGQWLYVDAYQVANDVCYSSESEAVKAFIEYNTGSTGNCTDIPELVPNGSWSTPPPKSSGSPYKCRINNNTSLLQASSRLYAVKRCGIVRGSVGFTRVRLKNLDPTNPRKSTEEQSCKKNKTASDPVVIATGEKIEDILDFSFPSISKLEFKRIYRSRNVVASNFSISKFGPGWSHNYDKNISFYSDTTTGDRYAVANRLGGKAFYFTKTQASTSWISPPDTSQTLIRYATYYEIETTNDIVERYDLNGKLILIKYKNNYQINLIYNYANHLTTVTDNIGNLLSFTYDASSRLSSVTKNSSEKVTYTYVNGMLDKVTNPDNTFMSYIYDDISQPQLITGVIDERGNRYATWSYDSSGRTLSGENANGIEKITFVYNADGSRTIKNSLNIPTTYNFETNNGYSLPLSIIGPGCSTCSTGDTNYSYDPNNGNLLTETTKGLTTQYSNYDTNHNAQTVIEAFGSPVARTTTYTFDSQYHSRVATKTEPSVFPTGNKKIIYIYDAFGNITNINTAGFTPTGKAVNRTVALQYNGPLHQLTQIDGPRPNITINDITTFDYYPNTAANGNNRARLKSVIQGGILLRSNIQYTASGKVSSETRINGLAVTYTYFVGNDRLKTYTETVGVKSRTTGLTYLPTGEVETITLAQGTPDSLMVTLGYDMARRLTSVKDAVNNRIEFVLDTESNVTDKNIYDSNGATGTLKRTLHQVFDVYSRLESITQENEISNYTFSPDGTLSFSSVGDSLKNEKTESSYQYDGLKRLTSITQNTTGTDPNISNLLIQYGYDVNDKLTKVIDPKNGTTTYIYDDLGNLLSQTSPDTGITNFINDEAGNRTEQTDANNSVLTYSYDGLNRIKSITGINPNDNINVTYDACIGGLGRLCGFTDASGQTGYQYDGFGRTTDQSHTELGITYKTNYVYNLLDRVTQITLPSSRIINKTYNSNAQVASIDATVAGTISVLIDNARYAADGQLSGFTYGNGYTENRSFDMAGRIVKQSMPKKPITGVPTPDTTAPIVSPPANITAEATATLTPILLGAATATDNVDTTVQATASTTGPFPLGITLVTWSATDTAGNIGTASQTITITDTTAPSITAPANVSVVSATPLAVTLGIPTTGDLFGPVTTSNNAPASFPLGITNVIWTATDVNGNSATATQSVTVTTAVAVIGQDTTAPVVTAPATLTQISSIPVEINIGQATATDLFLSDIFHDAPKFFPVGTTTVTWTAIDDYGNTATAPQLVTVTPVAVNQSASLITVSLSNANNNAATITKNTFTINPQHQSTAVVVMVTDELGKTQSPKAWYQSVTHGRWKIVTATQLPNLQPDVLMVISDSKIDLWQVNTDPADGKSKPLDHQQQLFNGKAWSLSQSLKQVNHTVWKPSQLDPLLRPEVTWQYVYDTRGNITTRTVDTTAQTFAYDALDRLTDDVFSRQVYGYDKNGNRTALTDNGTATSLAYDLNTNRMTSNGANTVVLDSVGNTTSDGNHTYGYNDHNRLTSVDTNITYVYSALGQRTRKVTPTGTTVYHYDLEGQLISETDDTGAPIKDYVYLDGQPIAQLSDVTGEPAVAYIHTDHLQTPRRVTDAAGKVVWSWDSDAFGKLSADTDSDGDGVAFEMNLRFAGQYFDSESGLHYNYFRYYDPRTGRYITSDPIGILRDYSDPRFQIAFDVGSLEITGFAGEELNHNYGYVGQNPLYWFDGYGLAKSKKPDGYGRSGGADHDKNKNPSNKPKHEGGDANRDRSRGRERGDNNRDAPRKRPDNWKKGPWPPKIWFPPIIDPCIIDPLICKYDNIYPDLIARNSSTESCSS